jgi:HAE1 family hydrophobic/amphiphilic exporter-1
MGGVVGRVFGEFAVTVSVAIIVSGFVSLTLTPMLCARIEGARSTKKPNIVLRAFERVFDSGFAPMNGHSTGCWRKRPSCCW